MNPFQAKYSSEFPKLLDSLGGSIMLTTYQTGKVIIINSDGERISQLVRDFERPMGVDFHGDLMAVALRDNVTVFKESEHLAKTYPKKKDFYDKLFYPVSLNKTTYIDAHDVVFSKQGIVVVNTAYSCLSKVDGQNSFVPIWKPPFIEELSTGDACHLNGACIDEDGDVRYVTAFGKTTKAKDWRLNKLTSGFLYDIKEERYLCENLSMPHSPRIYKNELYVLQSAKEEFSKVNRETGELELISKVDGFIRGLSFVDKYAFIGISKLRKSHTFGDLPIAKKRIQAGVVVVDLETKENIAEILYEDKLEEIYDVHFIPNSKKVNIINQKIANEYPAVITPLFENWINEENEEGKDSNK